MQEDMANKQCRLMGVCYFNQLLTLFHRASQWFFLRRRVYLASKLWTRVENVWLWALQLPTHRPRWTLVIGRNCRRVESPENDS
jgi:hypothetical protein